jgi:organic hydroperoxide reductase OsmC/OhrA
MRMHAYPHIYRVSASGSANGAVAVATAGVPSLDTAPPPEFGGPGGSWSPETMLVGALADCFVLSFRAVARAARFDYASLECHVEGVLDKQAGTVQFIEFRTRATLVIAPEGDAARARKLMETAEHLCLIANSLKAPKHLDCQVLSGSSSG